MVLERAAQTLAINRLAERDRLELSQQAQAGLLNALRQPRGLSDAEALARAASLGLKRSPFYVPVVFRTTAAHHSAGHGAVPPPGDPLAGQQDERELLELLARTLKASSSTALTASIRSGSVGMLLGLPARQLEDAVLQQLARAVAGQARPSCGAGAGGGPVLSWSMGVGRPSGSLLEAAAGIDEAAHVARDGGNLRDGGKPFYRATDVRLRGLLALLRHDPRVQQFVESELASVLHAEARGAEGYLDLLGRYLESGGNKAGPGPQRLP